MASRTRNLLYISDCLAWYSILLGKMALYGVLWLSISMVWCGMVWYGSVMEWYLEDTSWKVLAYDIYARVVDVSEIERVSAANE